MLYDMVRDDEIGPHTFDLIGDLWSGGDNLGESLRAGFSRKFQTPIHATYGLTEAPAIVAIEEIGGEHIPGASGKTLPHLHVHAADHDAADGPGELCVAAAAGGPFAGRYTPMLGYWRNPEATAGVLHGGELRTGDLGTVSPDGDVFVHDRRGLTIVRGGSNVYPAEVERLVQAFPGVVACAIVGVPDERLGSRVGAVVQMDRDHAPEMALREHCASSLARYKIPEVWRFTTGDFPRNAMGKINRARLLEMLG